MSWIHAMRERVTNLVLGRHAELDEEISYHLELETQRQIAGGADPETARRTALARFGDRRRITDATLRARGDRLMEGGAQDLRWSLRSLRNSPGFTALALFTLALGIGATTAAFTVLDTVLLQPLPYPESDRLVVIQELTKDKRTLFPSYPNFDDWRTKANAFAHVASITERVDRVTASDGETVRVADLGVSRDFFETLRVRPILGRTFTADENRLGGARVVMVSYEFWKTHMGGSTTLGTVRMGRDPATVVGVLPAGFDFLRHHDLYSPHERGPGTVRTAHYLTVMARLAPHTTLASARANMTGLSRQLASAYGTDTQAEDALVTPLRDHVVGKYRLVLDVVFGGATLVLLVACSNLVSAQLARGIARGREIAVRAALGASRARLVRQLLVESAVLAVAGAVLGAALGIGITRVISRVGADLMPRLAEMTVNVRLLSFSVGISVLVTLLIGLYPALRLARGNSASTLRGASRSTAPMVRARVWHALVGFEVAMAVLLLVASTLLVRTLDNILNSGVGFEIHGVITAALSTGDTPQSRIEQIESSLNAIPGVSGVALASNYPLEWGNMSAPVLRPTDPEDHDWPAFAGFRAVTPNYFAVLRQPIVKGRAFDASDRKGSPYVAVITPGIAQALWPGEDPIGKQLRSNQDVDHLLTIVGVVSEARNWSMAGPQNELYVPAAQHENWQSDPIAFIRVDRDTRGAAASIERLLRANARDIPAKVALLDDRVAATAASRRFAMVAMLAFGGIALLLAAVGIYGVLAYSVTSRQMEIGVRMALGATAVSILRRSLGGAAAMACAGVVAGLLASLAATRSLRSLLYGVTPFEPVAYVAAATLLLGAALFGAYVPARRASRVDPAIAIRGDA